jgi:periplasmic protein TonB
VKGGAWIAGALVTVAGHGALAAWIANRDPAAPPPPPRVTRFHLIAQAPKPPPAPPPAPPEPPRAIPRKVVRPRDLPPPQADPTPPPPAPAAVGITPDQDATQGGLAVPAGDGVSGPVHDGDGTEKQLAPPAPPAPHPRPGRVFVPIFEVTRMPRAIHAVQPDVPDAWRNASHEAVVVIEVAIGADGAVIDARVVKKAGSGLDEAALAAARATRFEPAMVGDRAVAVRMQIPYRFKVRG